MAIALVGRESITEVRRSMHIMHPLQSALTAAGTAELATAREAAPVKSTGEMATRAIFFLLRASGWSRALHDYYEYK